MSDLDILAAVLDHARAHRLVDTISSAGTGGGTASVYVSGTVGRERRVAFLRWCRSVGATVVETDTYYHRGAGVLADGTPVDVRVAVYACDDEPPTDLVTTDLDALEEVWSS